MRKDQDQLAPDDTIVNEADLSDMLRDFLAERNMTPADLQAHFDKMRAALELLPDEMPPQLMSFFISQTLAAYDVTGVERIELLMRLATATEGVDAKLMRMNDDGELEEVARTECDCPTCTAERAAEAKAASKLH